MRPSSTDRDGRLTSVSVTVSVALTCEVGGKVLQRRSIFIDRGQVKNLNLRKSIRRAAQ